MDAKRAVTEGRSPSQEKQRDKRRAADAKTFEEYTVKWLAEARMADSTRSMRKSIIDRDILPLIKNQLEFSASFLAGDGIGRYGSAQLPDATTKPDGTLAAIKGYDVLAGVTWKPIPTVSLYVYGGREHDDRTDLGSAVVAGKTVAYGYGNPLYVNSGCLIEGSTLGCDASTSSITQETLGGWWKFYQGMIGNMQVGLQLTHVKREIYSGVGGAPSTGINIGELSFRFYPFQK